MERGLQLQLLGELLELVERETLPEGIEDGLIPAHVYTSLEWLRAEQQVLFRELPLIVGSSSELKEPGDFLTHDATGTPLLVIRQADGTAQAFLNVCRHRGTRLVTEPCGQAKTFVCRYHAWSYTTGGALLRVPHREYFPSLCEEESGLIRVPCAERCGFLWVVPGGRGAALDIDAYLGPLSAELSGFSLATHHVHHKMEDKRQANWKLIMDAFLEGYHVRSLHRDTIARFFLEGTLPQAFPPHSRTLGARKTLLQARTAPKETWDLRGMTTPFYCLFPNTILVFHPDWVSVLSLYPQAVDRTLYSHRMLIPRPAESEEERRHWDKTFALIEGNVFQHQDMVIAESIQSGLAAQADTHFRIGTMEAPIKWFHDQVAGQVAGQAAGQGKVASRYHQIEESAVRIPLPDVRQKTDWSCGAAALQAIAGYFGVGPAEEQDFAKDMHVDQRIGAHPNKIESAARSYGLKVHSHIGMSNEELKSYLDQRKPVMLMIQAWGDPQVYSDDDAYQGVWREGHWVVAIGYDQDGFLFEDPALAVIRGYLSYDALNKRWRDTGPHGRHLTRLGIAIWMEGTDTPAYLRRAAHID